MEEEIKKTKKKKKEEEVSAPTFETIKRPAREKAEDSETIELLMDVELELTAELGSTELPLKNILDFTKGSIVKLDSYTSNPVDLLVNGKVIAKGEVVIIEDNFGLRVTDVCDNNPLGHKNSSEEDK